MSDAAQFTQIGNGRYFADRHGSRVRYVHQWNTWLVWDGVRWARDDMARLMMLAKETVAAMLQEAAELPEEDARKRAAAWALKSHEDHQLAAMLHLAQSEPGITAAPDLFDQQPYLFNVANGTIDLRSGTIRPHDPGDYLTQCSPIAFDPAATAPRWEQFLHEIFPDRPAMVGFLRQYFGYCLTGDTAEQLFVLPWGSGANGKSRYLEAVRHVLGEYARHMPFDTLAPRRGEGGPRNDIWRLHGARLVTAIETGAGRRFDEALLKSLTGGDTVTARPLYGEHVEFRPTFKLAIATNHRPTVSADPAVWRRLALVPFTVTITAEQRDPDLGTKLELEASGILNWLISGCIEWQQHGLQIPTEVTAATEAYRQAEDTLGDWLAECCDTSNPRATERSKGLFQSYCAWADRTGEEVLSQDRFGRELTSRGFGKARTSGFRQGIRLASLPEQDGSHGLDHLQESISRHAPEGGF